MNFNEYKKQAFENDPELYKEYKALEPEYDIVKAIIDARKKKGLTQKELSKITGIEQAHISRLENGNYNPSLHFLKRIATGLGKELHIGFM
jgi:predicted transcriptional regulator